MKKIWLIALFMTFAMTVAACSPGQNYTFDGLPVDANLDPNEEVTITFWHRMGANSQALLQSWITDFEAEYPNINVVEEKAAIDYDPLANKIALAITGGNAPDISESYPDHIARYMPSGAPLPLNTFISNPNVGYTQEEIQDFLPTLWAEGTSYDNQGTIYSMPFTKSTEALFYNKTVFDQHSIGEETYTEIVNSEDFKWDDVFAIAEDIKTWDINAVPFGYDSTDNLFISASEQWSAPYTGLNDETGQGEILFNNETSKNMVRYFKDKVDRGLMLTRSLNGDGFMSDIYKTGRSLYMYVGSTGGTRYAYENMSATVFENGVPALYTGGVRAGVAPLPSYDGVTRRQIQQGPNINLYKSGSEQQMIAAWLFVKYMTTAERSLEFSLPSGYASIRYSSYQEDAWSNFGTHTGEPIDTKEAIEWAQDELVKQAIQIFLDNSDIFFTSAVFNLSSDTRSEVGSLIDKIFAYQSTSETDLNNYIDTQYQESYDFLTN